jgi:ketosteroid isomerase-like protein
MSHAKEGRPELQERRGMSQRSVEIVVGTFEAVNVRDFKAVMAAYADDIVLALHGDLRGLGPEGAVGKEAAGEWFGDWFRTFDRDYRFEVDEAHDWGDRVFIVATHHGRGRASGAPMARRNGWIYTVREEKIVRCDIYTDPESALAAESGQSI